MQMAILGFLGILLIYRIYMSVKSNKNKDYVGIGYAQTIGNREFQSDLGEIFENEAGSLMVLADGVGKLERGKISAYIAVETIMSLYESYTLLPNPEYFFRRGFNLANSRIKKVLEGREGGTSLACAVVSNKKLFYVLAGDVKIAIHRNKELIPLSEGHTVNKLVENAYKQGKVSRQEALNALNIKRIYNYVGGEGFSELEIFDLPVNLKENDKIVLLTKGIYEQVAWQVLEKILADSRMDIQQQAKSIVDAVKCNENTDIENGSILILPFVTNGAV